MNGQKLIYKIPIFITARGHNDNVFKKNKEALKFSYVFIRNQNMTDQTLIISDNKDMLQYALELGFKNVIHYPCNSDLDIKYLEYLGTYKYTDEIDIIHSSHDISVSYDSPVADYRVYQNIEEWSSKQIPISKCEQFEKAYTILNQKVSITRKGFYEIQKDFFIRAIKVNQESAKKMVLRKYRRHSN